MNKPTPEFRAKDLKQATVSRSNPANEIGLKFEKRGKEYYVKEVSPTGLFYRHHGDKIQVGDRVWKVNGKLVEEEFPGLFQVNKYIRDEMKLTVHVVRQGRLT